MEPKYDIAISCAEEDLQVAIQLAEAMKSTGISYYLYTEHRAENWGQNVFRITLDKYGAEARFVLLLISSIYITKYWSGIEHQIAETIPGSAEPYMLPLRLDDTPVNGLSNNILFERWKNNPMEIATLIKAKLALSPAEKIKGTASPNTIKNVTMNARTIISADGHHVTQTIQLPK